MMTRMAADRTSMSSARPRSLLRRAALLVTGLFALAGVAEACSSDSSSADAGPTEAWSCHTALIDGYPVEGHVPVEAIEDLLAERPDIDGIALPGMRAGSPGMPGEKASPFEVLAIDDGTLSAFGAY